MAVEGDEWQRVMTRDRGGLREPPPPQSPWFPEGEMEGSQHSGWVGVGVTAAQDKEAHAKAWGSWLSAAAAAGDDDKTPGSGHSVLTAPAQNIHLQQKSGARDPQAKSTQGKTTARKGWRVTQGPDTHPLQQDGGMNMNFLCGGKENA